jgi:hypothetical protein
VTISFNENHDLIMEDGGYMISNQHYVTTIREFPSEPLNPLDPEWEQTNDIPLGIVSIIYLEYQESHEYDLVCKNLLLRKSNHFQNLKISILFIQICLMMITYMSIHQLIMQ